MDRILFSIGTYYTTSTVASNNVMVASRSASSNTTMAKIFVWRQIIQILWCTVLLLLFRRAISIMGARVMTDCQTNTKTNTNNKNTITNTRMRSSLLCRAISIMGEGAMTDCQTKTSRYCLSSPYYTPVLTTTRTRKKKTSQEVRMLSRSLSDCH